MKKTVIIGLAILLAIGVVGSIFVRGYLVLFVLGLTFAIPISCFHELGHFISAKYLGYKPSVIFVSFLILPSAVAREDINNQRHEKIVSISGPLGGLFAFAVITILFAPMWLLILMGLFIVLYPSKVDFMEFLSLTGGRSETDMLKMKVGAQYFPWLLVFSKERWEKRKAIIEQRIGAKLNFREVVLG